MDTISVTGLTGILIILTISLLGFIFIQRRRLPPGPWGIPILGCIPFWKGPETNVEWFKKYGDIYSVKMGPFLNVYLNTMTLVNRYLKDSEVLVDRPTGPAAIGQGILFGSGEKWRLNRKLCFPSLRSDTSVQTFDQHFQNEAVDMMAEIETYSGKEFNLTNALRPCFVNGLITLIKGSRFEWTDPRFVKLVSLLREVDNIDLMSLSAVISLKLPKLWSLIPHNSPSLLEITTELGRNIRMWIVQRKESAQGRYSSEVLIDSFLNSEEYRQINSTDNEMVQSALDMFNGGLVSSLSAIEFLFLYLIYNPDIQNRIQQEIDDVIGSDRKPTWGDNINMPYTEAAIMETMRLACITPSTLPHVAVRDVTIEGYDVPKGSAVLASVMCLHKQSAVFENPEVFNPERFLNADNTICRSKDIIPFGIEPRTCPGDRWFHVYMFLVVTSILQRYNVSQPHCKELPPFNARLLIVRRLVPYNLLLTPRATV